MPQDTKKARIGVLALQGSFREHIAILNKIDQVISSEVRTESELEMVDGLVIPGGESTTMALVAEKWGLLPALRRFASEGKPMWGTCAGLIFLADRATGQKEGGQALVGGLDCLVHRNFFGAQINSFETMLECPTELKGYKDSGVESDKFRAVFIRAPAITEVGPTVQVLATYSLSEEEQGMAQGTQSVVVAVRSGNLVATSFHPELTADTRWHRYFSDIVKDNLAKPGYVRSSKISAAGKGSNVNTKSSFRPADLPVY